MSADGLDATGAGGPDPAVPGVLGEAALALVVLMSLGEPGDKRLHALVSERGPVEALRAIREGEPVRGVERWRVRLPAVDVPAQLAAARGCGARLVLPGTSEWPSQLDALDVPPLALWVRGSCDLRLAALRSVAVVGSRAATGYGGHVAGELAYALTCAGWTVVSGGAYGIDAAAHRGALTAGGPTIAVLANGIDRTYPAGNTALVDRIAAEGLVVTELPPGQHPARSRFLQRNRIIAGLTRGSVAVEMARRSGAASTLNHSLALSRHAMAVPGPVTSAMSAGCHAAIRAQEAVLVTGADDVLSVIAPVGEVLPDEGPREADSSPLDVLTQDQLRVYDALPGRGPRDLESLVVAAGLPMIEVADALTALLLAGLASFDGRHARRLP
jgi:DNA processing protein